MKQEDVMYLQKDLEKCKVKFKVSDLELYNKAYKNDTNYEPPPIVREQTEGEGATDGQAQ